VTRWAYLLLVILTSLGVGAGCKKGGGPPPEPGMDASVDGAVDASVDAGMDAAMDASTDAATDAGMDASMDGGMCAPGLDPCPTGCVDLNTDNGNCGTCGMVCMAPMVCTGGLCLAPP